MLYLKDLTEMDGISGNEERVCSYIIENITPFLDNPLDSVTIDRLGNLIISKKGFQSDDYRIGRNYKVLICPHMDEVGIMITGYTDKGFLKLAPVNPNMDPQMLQGKGLKVGEKGLQGIVGLKPIHLKRHEKDDKRPGFDDLYIDIGATTREESMSLVKKGEYACFEGMYEEYGENCIKSKAFDDRAGCSIVMEVLQERFAFDLYAGFSVQEEVGMRGAKTIAYAVKPDIGIVVEGGGGATDMPFVREKDYGTLMGEGAITAVEDGTTCYDRGLTGLFVKTARKYSLKLQPLQASTGVCDSTCIQMSNSGVRMGIIDVPGRYVHTPAGIMDKRDYIGTRDLLIKSFQEMGADRCKALYEITGGVHDVRIDQQACRDFRSVRF